MTDTEPQVKDIETELAQPFEPTEIQTEINQLNNSQPQQALDESPFGPDSDDEE